MHFLHLAIAFKDFDLILWVLSISRKFSIIHLSFFLLWSLAALKYNAISAALPVKRSIRKRCSVLHSCFPAADFSAAQLKTPGQIVVCSLLFKEKLFRVSV